MLLYKFPKKLSAQQQLERASEQMKVKKKIKKLEIQNIILSAAAVLLIWRVPIIWLKLLAAFFIVACIAVNSVILLSVRRQEDSGAYTEIFDDRIKHKQANLFNFRKTKYKEITVFYKDIKASAQDVFGNLQLKLNSGQIISLYFCDTNTKLFLIKNLYKEIKYPKREFKDLSSDEVLDKDDPDYNWKNWKDL